MKVINDNQIIENCRKFQDEGIALALVEHELSADEEKFWLDHIENCESCLACVADLLYMDAHMKNLASLVLEQVDQKEETGSELLSLNRLEIECELPEDLFDEDGDLLLAKGTRMTPAIIDILQSRGIEKVRLRKPAKEVPAPIRKIELEKPKPAPFRMNIEETQYMEELLEELPQIRIEYLDDDEINTLEADDFREGFFFAGETTLEPRFRKRSYINLVEKTTPEEAIRQDTKIRALNTLEESFASIHESEKIDVEAVREVTNEIVDQLLLSEKKTLSLADLFLFSSKIYTHSFNTLVIFITLAKSMEIGRDEIASAGEVVLFHDLGRLLPIKDGKDDRDYYRNHPLRGYRHLMKMGGFHENMLSLVLNHHERFDGKGFPRGITGERLGVLEQLLIVSNTYDKAVTDPVHRVKRDFHSAAQIIYQSTNKLVAADITSIFLNAFGIYPPGTYVRLKSGEEGLVKEANYSRPFQPVVTLIKDRNGLNLLEPLDIDLRELEHTSIERSIDIAPLLENYQ